MGHSLDCPSVLELTLELLQRNDFRGTGGAHGKNLSKQCGLPNCTER